MSQTRLVQKHGEPLMIHVGITIILGGGKGQEVMWTMFFVGQTLCHKLEISNRHKRKALKTGQGITESQSFGDNSQVSDATKTQQDPFWILQAIQYLNFGTDFKTVIFCDTLLLENIWVFIHKENN